MDEPKPALVPELRVSDIARSMAFYQDVVGFSVLYARPEERFAYLVREGAHLMIEQPVEREFIVGPLTYPFGRGVNFQIEVSDIRSLHAHVSSFGVPLYLDLEDRWYRRDGVLVGNRQFAMQDLDGYLLRFFEDLGERPV